MATTIGAGIGGAVGWGLETTYGTFPASINQFYEVTKAAATKTKKTIQSSGLASGRYIDLSARRALSSQAGTAQLDLEVMQSGHFGQLLKSVFGTTAAPVQQGAPSLATAASGGTIAAGTYQVQVTYVTATGETGPTASASIVTTGSASTITITSPSAATGATGWYAYVTQAGGNTYTRQQAAGSPTAIGSNLTLTAPPTSSGANPPAGGAFLQTHTLLTLAGISATIQAAIPDTSGVQHQYNFVGSKATGATFSCGIDTFLTASLTYDVMQVQETGALAAPSYPVLNPFNFAQSGFKWGAFGSEAQIDGVKKVDVKIERKQNVNRYYQGAGGFKREPITNDPVAITGTIESDYVNKTYFADLFASDTPQSLIWSFTGPLLSPTSFATFQIALPSVFIDSPGPQLDGKDIVSTSFAFTALNDGTNPPITLTYISTDSTL